MSFARAVLLLQSIANFHLTDLNKFRLEICDPFWGYPFIKLKERGPWDSKMTYHESAITPSYWYSPTAFCRADADERIHTGRALTLPKGQHFLLLELLDLPYRKMRKAWTLEHTLCVVGKRRKRKGETSDIIFLHWLKWYQNGVWDYKRWRMKGVKLYQRICIFFLLLIING